MAYAVIRIRGTVNVRGDIKDTLKMLRLTRANHCVVVPETDSYKGMLQKVKDYVTWGEIDAETMARLLYLRGKLVGGNPISESFVREKTDYDSIEDLAKAIVSNEVSMNSIDGLKPVFRLHPPIGGFKKIRRAYSDGGCLGYRGKDINLLLERMMEDRGHKDGEEKE
jgi:large subunit ribosomal protein L30